jgi:glycosyltransferase involved in cell wall biosynthesis
MHKICHITSVHPRYDIRIFVKECTTLATNGYQVSLIVADEFADEVKNGVQIFSIGKAISRKDRMFKHNNKILNKIIQLKPDIVHFHDPELMLLGLKLHKMGIKVIYDVHEDLPKQILNKHWLPKLVRPFVSQVVKKIEKKCAQRLAAIITATPLIAKRFSKFNNNTLTIYNYPMLSELSRDATDYANREYSLCYIGSISKTRGIIPLVESLAISKLKLELAGALSGDIDIKEIKSLPGGEYVNYHGVLSRDQVANLLHKTKIGIVTLLPTPSYIESMPIKMFEYMLAGMPIIASNFTLWEEIVTQYNCGILVDPEDKNSIAMACKKLIEDPQLAKKMGQLGQQVVQELLNWEIESKKLLNFYQEIINN